MYVYNEWVQMCIGILLTYILVLFVSADIANHILVHFWVQPFSHTALYRGGGYLGYYPRDDSAQYARLYVHPSEAQPHLCPGVGRAWSSVHLPHRRIILLPYAHCSCGQTSALRVPFHIAEEPVSSLGVSARAPSAHWSHRGCIKTQGITKLQEGRW